MSGDWSAEDRAGQEWAERAYKARCMAKRLAEAEKRLAELERGLAALRGQDARIDAQLVRIGETAALLETETAVYAGRMA